MCYYEITEKGTEDARYNTRVFLFLLKRRYGLKKKIAGILLIVLSVGALGFWELWGRENISYRKVAVLKSPVEAHTVITEDMLRPKKMEEPSAGAIPWEKAGTVVGLETKCFIAGNQELHPENFRETEFRTGKEYDRYVLSIPETWLMSQPGTLKRGDKAFIFLGEELIMETVVAHVKDNYGMEVTYDDRDRYYPSGRTEEIEIIVTSEQMKKLDLLVKKGNRFNMIYAEDTDDDV
jgi:hypothetical protein